MANNHTHLNGAYYGPSIPPRQSYHRPGSDGDCGCCGCLFKILIEIIITIIIAFGIAALVFWLIFRPNLVKFHVTEAELTQFELAPNNSLLTYNLKINLTIRNPNKKIGIYYEKVEATAIYENERFAVEYFGPFYQGHKNTTMLSPVFDGQRAVVLGAKGLSNYNSDENARVYNIDVKLQLRVKYKVGSLKTFQFKPRIKCELKVPLSSNGSTGSNFETTKCDMNWKVF